MHQADLDVQLEKNVALLEAGSIFCSVVLECLAHFQDIKSIFTVVEIFSKDFQSGIQFNSSQYEHKIAQVAQVSATPSDKSNNYSVLEQGQSLSCRLCGMFMLRLLRLLSRIVKKSRWRWRFEEWSEQLETQGQLTGRERYSCMTVFFQCWIDSGAPLLKHIQCVHYVNYVYLSLACPSPICASHTIVVAWGQFCLRDLNTIMCVCMYCIYTCMDTLTCRYYNYMHTILHIYIYTQLYTYICVYIYIHVYIYI